MRDPPSADACSRGSNRRSRALRIYAPLPVWARPTRVAEAHRPGPGPRRGVASWRPTPRDTRAAHDLEGFPGGRRSTGRPWRSRLRRDCRRKPRLLVDGSPYQRPVQPDGKRYQSCWNARTPSSCVTGSNPAPRNLNDASRESPACACGRRFRTRFSIGRTKSSPSP